MRILILACLDNLNLFFFMRVGSSFLFFEVVFIIIIFDTMDTKLCWAMHQIGTATYTAALILFFSVDGGEAFHISRELRWANSSLMRTVVLFGTERMWHHRL